MRPATEQLPGLSDPWALRTDGAGPATFGSTIAELGSLIVAPSDSSAISDGCHYVRVRGAPDGMGFMMEGRRLVRIDVFEGDTPTAEGVRIGDSEARVLGLHPTAERRPHKYTAGAYLVVAPGAPADSLHRLVFETDGIQVTQFRSGLFPQVEYVERCG